MSKAGSDKGETPVYAQCFVCGKSNEAGLAASFHRDPFGEVWTEFVPEQRHQGYPGVCHGGILYSLLDETIGRATYHNGNMTVTASMTIRYRKPVPIGARVRITGRLLSDRGRVKEAAGEAVLEDGTVVAEATGKFVPLSSDEQEKVAEVLDWE